LIGRAAMASNTDAGTAGSTSSISSQPPPPPPMAGPHQHFDQHHPQHPCLWPGQDGQCSNNCYGGIHPGAPPSPYPYPHPYLSAWHANAYTCTHARKFQGWEKRFRAALLAMGDAELVLLPRAMALAQREAYDMQLRGALFDDVLRRCRRDAEQDGVTLTPPPPPPPHTTDAAVVAQEAAGVASLSSPSSSASASNDAERAGTTLAPPSAPAATQPPPSQPSLAATERETESSAAGGAGGGAAAEDAVEDVDEDACAPTDEDDAQDADPVDAFTIMCQNATLPINPTRILSQSKFQNNADVVVQALKHTAPKPKKAKTAPKASRLLFADTTCGSSQMFTRKLSRNEWDIVLFDLKYNKTHPSGSYTNVLEPSEMVSYTNRCDATAVDPPYKMISGGHHFSNCTSKSTSFMQQQERYGIDVQLDQVQILGLYSKLMQSAVLITKAGGRVLVKCQASPGFPLDGLVLEIARSIGRLRYLTKFILETNCSSNSNAENFSTLIVFEKTTMTKKKKDDALVVDDIIGKRNLEDDAARRELQKLTDNRFQTQASDALAKVSVSNNVFLIMLRHLVSKGTEPEQVKQIAHSYLENFADKSSVGFRHTQNLINSFDPDKVSDNYSAVMKATAKKRREEEKRKRSHATMVGIGSERRNASADAKRR